ncbi:hypothetical protein CTI12_AA409320 [Artemisia annua]|uniref:Ubiquitin-like domain-containing protein n=1 Tax=Artemisia annua TaxID=35608 RepID=A0A2U1M8F2_ARTAN|nr:hypothetical protein CTI12_AA409320 [Artemisia annua]
MNCNTHTSQIFIQDPDFQIPIQTLTLAPNFTIHDLKQLFFKNKSYASTLTSSSYFTLNGRILPDNGTVKTTGIQDFETLTLKLSLYGGSGDGGSTCAESHDCYLNMYADKKPDKVDPNEQRLSKWEE